MRNIRWAPDLQHSNQPRRKKEGTRAAAEGNQRIFGEQLPHEAPLTRSERTSDGNILLARNCARQLQISDVGARNQQHEANRS